MCIFGRVLNEGSEKSSSEVIFTLILIVVRAGMILQEARFSFSWGEKSRTTSYILIHYFWFSDPTDNVPLFEIRIQDSAIIISQAIPLGSCWLPTPETWVIYIFDGIQLFQSELLLVRTTCANICFYQWCTTLLQQYCQLVHYFIIAAI